MKKRRKFGRRRWPHRSRGRPVQEPPPGLEAAFVEAVTTHPDFPATLGRVQILIIENGEKWYTGLISPLLEGDTDLKMNIVEWDSQAEAEGFVSRFAKKIGTTVDFG